MRAAKIPRTHEEWQSLNDKIKAQCERILRSGEPMTRDEVVKNAQEAGYVYFTNMSGEIPLEEWNPRKRSYDKCVEDRRFIRIKNEIFSYPPTRAWFELEKTRLINNALS